MTENERKIFYVDVGNMPIEEIREYLTKEFDKKREGDKTEV
jgi:hypothetical protein